MLHKSLLANEAQCEPHFDALAEISHTRVRSGFKILAGMVKVCFKGLQSQHPVPATDSNPEVRDTEPADHAKFDRKVRAG